MRSYSHLHLSTVLRFDYTISLWKDKLALTSYDKQLVEDTWSTWFSVRPYGRLCPAHPIGLPRNHVNLNKISLCFLWPAFRSSRQLSSWFGHQRDAFLYCCSLPLEPFRRYLMVQEIPCFRLFDSKIKTLRTGFSARLDCHPRTL